AETGFSYPDQVDLPGWKPATRGHPKQIKSAAKAIAAAERPMLYVGGGVLNADACAELRDLAETARLPVVTTLMAKGALSETRALHADGVRPKTEPWLRQLADWREEFPLKYGNGGDMLKPQLVLETLQALTADRDDVIWTTGVGQHQMWAMQYLLCNRPRTFITSGGLGTMGYGVPAAVGAKAARPDATVVCIDGDGCFQMTSQELATAALERLPIVSVIINNGWLGMVRQWQEMFYDERFAQTHLTHSVPDYAQLAEAYGCAGFTVESEDQLEDAL